MYAFITPITPNVRLVPDIPVADVYRNNFLENWTTITKIRKPIIAAVSGYAVRNFCSCPTVSVRP
jgi:enoyl-CoA hydratase